MDDSPEKEMKDLMEEIADDLEYAANNENVERRKKPPDSKSQAKILVLWSGVILLLIVIVALLFGGGNEVATEKPTSIQAGLDQIEERLQRLEGMYERIARLEKEEQALQQSIARTDRSRQSLAERLDRLFQEVETLRKRQAPVAAKIEAQGVVKEKGGPEAKRQYHIVRAGDSLYGIARKYGVSVDDLRRLNNLRPKQVIYPGQKLLVSQGSGQ
ncbi:MAG: LysM peptidoglycan-binding domain-containing protein [Desulfobacteraceae bacterium]|nr:MAG: LysM peptidoglycan-binding domain-containing protein [Desulfobacteraceae bacterium]